ncbi:MAG: ABC transporter permease [Acholeplasmataceae bacterium]|nr:ABC transporter permease [Acholeplasmataceae bacterium]
MLKYLAKRMGLMVITFVIGVFLYFTFLRLIPDNQEPPIGSDNTYYEELVKKEGWDKPIPVQFAYWVRNIFKTGSFGYSKDYARDVSAVYFGRIPATVKVNIVPYILSIPIAISVGVLAALYKNRAIDHIISVGIIVFISVPTFVTYVVAQYIFYYKLGWAPDYKIAAPMEIAEKGFWYGVSTYIMPITLITIVSIPGSARTVRAELTEQLTQDYILLAQSKGLTRTQATFRHALKNAIAPFLPGMIIGVIGVISGSVIVEQIFRVNGTGGLFLAAFNSRDFAMVMLGTTFSQFVGLIASILSDISLTFFDPRVRVGSGKIAS